MPGRRTSRRRRILPAGPTPSQREGGPSFAGPSELVSLPLAHESVLPATPRIDLLELAESSPLSLRQVHPRQNPDWFSRPAGPSRFIQLSYPRRLPSSLPQVLRARSSSRGSPLPAKQSVLNALRGVSIRAPSRLRACIQRGVRREVLFAFGVGGSRGRQRGKRYRRNSMSYYSCR